MKSTRLGILENIHLQTDRRVHQGRRAGQYCTVTIIARHLLYVDSARTLLGYLI